MIILTYKLIKRMTTKRIIWLLAIVTLALSIVMLVVRIPDGIAQGMGYSGSQSMFAPDAAAFAPAGTAYAKLAIYGEEGRKAYFYNSLLFDLVYPVSYALLLSTGFTALFNRMMSASNQWQKLSLLFLLAGIFDLLENLSIYSMIVNYPNHLEWVDSLTAVLTTTKALLGYGGFLILLVGWSWWLIRIGLLRFQLTKPQFK